MMNGAAMARNVESDTNPTEKRRRKPRSYSKHGLVTLKQVIKGLGSRVIDRRTTLGKSLAKWRADLIEDLGGPDEISTQQSALGAFRIEASKMNPHKSHAVPALRLGSRLTYATPRTRGNRWSAKSYRRSRQAQKAGVGTENQRLSPLFSARDCRYLPIELAQN